MDDSKTNLTEPIDDSGAAIICEHIALEGLPILYAKRDDPCEPTDSGWQFVCYSGKDEDENGAQVWSINEVLEYEPTLAGLLEEPPGTILFREAVNEPWQIVRDN